MTKLKNVVVLDKKALLEIANGEKKVDGRKNNTGLQDKSVQLNKRSMQM